LYRGVRGELPEAFWLRNNHGEVTALDLAMMSTSRDEAVSASFLDAGAGGTNVMWELKCKAEDDTGYHNAADVSLLSQYPEEKEVLFPPLTMLVIQDKPEQAATAAETCPSAGKTPNTKRTYGSVETANGTVKFLRIVATATFV
jgi:hypothetical protein